VGEWTHERVSDLESLQAVTPLGLLADDVHDRVDELSSLSVVTLGPVVSSRGLSEDEAAPPTSVMRRRERAGGDVLVGAEELSEGRSTYIATSAPLVPPADHSDTHG
jgi:hypothetical protein